MRILVTVSSVSHFVVVVVGLGGLLRVVNVHLNLKLSVSCSVLINHCIYSCLKSQGLEDLHVIIMLLKKNKDTSGKCSWGGLHNCYHYATSSADLSSLNLYYADVSQTTKYPQIVGSTSVDQNIRCISWGENDQIYPMGLLATGSQNGVVSIWDPSKIIGNKGGQIHGLLCEQEAYQQSPVLSIQFNPVKKNLVATGSTEVLIIDIKKGQMQIYGAGQNNPHQGNFITSVAWNLKVDKILASASENGQVVFWDVKSNKQIFQLAGEYMQSSRNVSLSWNNQISTQIALAFDDDHKRQIQIWDLRNKRGPLKRIQKGHSKGITCLDWSTLDSELLLASSRDNKVICWNVSTQQIVGQITTKQAIVDLKWNKKVPSVFMAGTNQSTQIYCLSEKQLHAHAPQWYKPQVGCTVLFNNNICTFTSQKPGVTLSSVNSQQKCYQSVIKRLEQILRKHQSNSQEDFYKASKIMSDPSDKAIYDFLEFQIDKIIKSAEDYTGKKSKSAFSSSKSRQYSSITADQAQQFFKTLGQQQHNVSYQHEQKGQVEYINKNWNSGKQRIIKQNLLIGNFQGAVQVALKCGRRAEGLIIAYFNGKQLFQSALKTFFTETTQPFIKDILKNLVDSQFDSLVKKYDLTCWKQCLALIISKGLSDRNSRITALGKRLLDQGNKAAAIICFVISQNSNEIVSLLSHSYKELSGVQRYKQLLEAVCKVAFLSITSTKQTLVTPQLQNMLFQAALVLRDQNRPDLAFQLLSLLPLKNKYFCSYTHRLAIGLGKTYLFNQKIISVQPMKKDLKQKGKSHQQEKKAPSTAPQPKAQPLPDNKRRLPGAKITTLQKQEIYPSKIPGNTGVKAPQSGPAPPPPPPPSTIKKQKQSLASPPPPPKQLKQQNPKFQPKLQPKEVQYKSVETEQKQTQQKKQIKAGPQVRTPPPPPPPLFKKTVTPNSSSSQITKTQTTKTEIQNPPPPPPPQPTRHKIFEQQKIEKVEKIEKAPQVQTQTKSIRPPPPPPPRRN